MDFVTVVDQAIALLRQRGRLTYRTLQLQFQLDDAHLAALKDELIEGQRLAADEGGRVLVWTGDTATPVSPASPASVPAPPPAASAPPEAERRQLTVLFCDLVDSTRLASQLDPEDLREVVLAYQKTCATVIARFDGYIAQYLGDGLLVYFGYPLAHEDDAQRAVRAGLGIVEAMGHLNTRLTQERGLQLAVRLGIHTGLVVVGEVGGGSRQEQLALGETPNLAARLQGLAAPNTLVISAATSQLLGGFFACASLGTPPLKGLAQPIDVYQVLHERRARSRLEATGHTSLTPLVGREQESTLLRERWAQVKDGSGQVVLLNGEAGIGKSRLVQGLTEHVAAEPQAWLMPCQGSPYHQNTAFYPLIDLLEQVALRFEREETLPQKLGKLEGFLGQYGLPLAETVPLFAALLSLPLPAHYPPLTVAPERQKQQTLHALLTLFLRIATQQPLLYVLEDLHWVDPTTLDLLTLLVDQGPTARLLVLLTFRPDFPPPWTGRAHLTQITVHRLPHRQAVEVLRQVAHGKALPPDVVEQIVTKTDGVPLFVEELTKMVLESGLLQERDDRYELTGPLPPLAIPATLHDSLMARLDRLDTVKSLAQLGATLGREFSAALLQAVAPWDERTVQRGLHQLVAAELLYQRGRPPQTTYVFKHALIQEAAYQSLLRSTRQQYHQRIAQVLETQFPEIVATQPALVAHHYTEAGLAEPAITYWQHAGQQALQRSANLEAVQHLRKGIEVLQTLPDTPARTPHELTLLLALGRALVPTQGFAAPDVEHVYGRARALCQQVGEAPQLFSVVFGLRTLAEVRGDLATSQTLGAQLLVMAQGTHDPVCLLGAHQAVGITSFLRGEAVAARTHLEQGLALYSPSQHRTYVSLYGEQDPGVSCRCFAAWALWVLGAADQALEQIHAAQRLAQELGHPYAQVWALLMAVVVTQLRGEGAHAIAAAEAAVALATAQGFALLEVWATMFRGWALAGQGRREEGMGQLRQGLSVTRVVGVECLRPWWLLLLAEVAGQAGQPEVGLALLTEAHDVMDTTGERFWAAERQRLQGVLVLQQMVPDAPLAETCFQQALVVARRQHAKALELRAAMSLARLWQQQGKRTEAYKLLAPIYGWFTEGFDTADLQEAKALLEELAE